MSTEVIIQSPNSRRPLYRKFVRDGVEGNYQIVFEMVRLIRNDVDYDIGLDQLAAQILKDSGLDSYSSPESQLRAIFDAVKNRVTYIQDIAGRIESLKSARRTWLDKFGDCDDQTVLNCTLAGCIGFENVCIAMAKYDANAQSFAHVYCTVYANGKRYVLDTSLPNARFNEEIKPVAVQEINVFSDIKGYDGLSGAYNQARYHARKAARFAIGVVPGAVNVLPLGFVAGNALATGASLIDQSKSNGASLSLPNTASEINKRLDEVIVQLVKSQIAYDLAKSEAASIAAHLATVDAGNERYAFTVVRASIKEKLDFINNFESYAAANNIKVVYLDATKMFAVGLALAGGTVYALYKKYKSSR